MVASSADELNPNQDAEHPIYLTDAGRKRLQDRLTADIAERERLAPVDPTEVRDIVDEADRLEAAEALVQLDDRIAAGLTGLGVLLGTATVLVVVLG